MRGPWLCQLWIGLCILLLKCTEHENRIVLMAADQPSPVINPLLHAIFASRSARVNI
jgi:hypothetical protein